MKKNQITHTRILPGASFIKTCSRNRVPRIGNPKLLSVYKIWTVLRPLWNLSVVFFYLVWAFDLAVFGGRSEVCTRRKSLPKNFLAWDKFRSCGLVTCYDIEWIGSRRVWCLMGADTFSKKLTPTKYFAQKSLHPVPRKIAVKQLCSLRLFPQTGFGNVVPYQ